ncbi:hypothetical protein ACTXT7_013633 [Hymenolepis weldensis]
MDKVKYRQLKVYIIIDQKLILKQSLKTNESVKNKIYDILFNCKQKRAIKNRAKINVKILNASGERTTSSSASKRSLSAPPGSSEESRSGSLPSVRRVSPQRPQTAITNLDPCKISTKLYLHHPELSRKKSDAAELKIIEIVDSHWISMTKSMMNRQRRIKALLQRQEKLKAELTDAKLRLLADPGSWSFDLNVAENMDPDEEGYLEALADETELLQQRVDACRSHAQYLVYFNPGPPTLPQPSSSGGAHESPH